MTVSTAISMKRVLLGGVISLGLAGPGVADTLLTNGKIFTANHAAPSAEAVGIRDRKIIAVGTLADVKASLAEGYDTIDLKGATLLPGLVDGHVHATFAGFSTLAAELPREVTSVEGLAAFAEEAIKSGQGMIGNTLRIGNLTGSFWENPDALDKVFNAPPFAEVPLVLAGSDAHTGWANRPMLERAGVTKAYIDGLPAEEQLFFGRKADGSSNGFTVDHGWDVVMGAMPPLSDEMVVESSRAGIKVLNSVGVTAFLDPIANIRPAAPIFNYHPKKEDSGAFIGYSALSKRGELNAHVTGLVLLHADSGPEDLAVFDAVRDRFANVENLKVGGVKILADGVVEFPGQTASLSKNYVNSGKPGPSIIGTDKFKQMAIELDKRGGLLHIHAIGDLAVKHALDAFEAIRKANGDSGILHSITHLELIRPEDFSRFAPLGVAATLQLLWSGADEYTVDLTKPYIDPSLYQDLYPAKKLWDSGAIVAGASDWPVSSPNPFDAMRIAITREGSRGKLFPEQALTAENLLYAYTINAAKAISRDKEIGSIEVGKSADLALVDTDILHSTPDQIAGAKVIWTLFQGKKVYEAGK